MRIYEYLGSRKPLIIMRFTSLIYCYPQFLQTKYIPLLTDCSSSTQTIYADDPTTRPCYTGVVSGSTYRGNAEKLNRAMRAANHAPCSTLFVYILRGAAELLPMRPNGGGT